MAKDIVLEVRCVGCGELVTPNEVDWLLFRLAGLAVHNTARCHDKANARFFGKEENSSKNTP